MIEHPPWSIPGLWFSGLPISRTVHEESLRNHSQSTFCLYIRNKDILLIKLSSCWFEKELNGKHAVAADSVGLQVTVSDNCGFFAEDGGNGDVAKWLSHEKGRD